jgi:hypothetical protein
MSKRRKITRRGFLRVSALATVGAVAAAGGVGWSLLSKEHTEAKSLALNAVDLSSALMPYPLLCRASVPPEGER